MDNVKILAIVGMSGSGKSVVVDHLTDKGYPKVYFGGMIYKEMEKRGIERTADGESEKKNSAKKSEKKKAKIGWYAKLLPKRKISSALAKNALC